MYSQILYNGLGTASLQQEDPKSALEFFTKAQAVTKATLGDDHPSYSLRRILIASAYADLRDDEQAERELRFAADAREAVKGRTMSELTLLLECARLGMREQRFVEAEALYEQANRLVSDRYEHFGHAGLSLRCQLGTIAKAFGDLDRAHREFTKAAQISDSLHITESKMMSEALQTHAEVLEQLGRFEEAREASGRARDYLPQIAR